MDKEKYLKPFTIFTDIMKCFFTACGFILLILFFDNSNIEITKELLRKGVMNIFVSLMICYMGYHLFAYIWYQKEKEASVASTLPLGIARRKDVVVPKKLSDKEELKLKIICIHEAGHAIVAYMLGLNVEYVIAKQDRGITATQIQENPLTNAEYLRKCIIVDYGGAAAEKVITGEIKAGSIGVVHSDFSKAEERIKNMLMISDKYKGYTSCGSDFGEQVQRTSIELFDMAEKIVSENRDVIEKLAGELKKHGEIEKAKIQQIVEIIKKEDKVDAQS